MDVAVARVRPRPARRPCAPLVSTDEHIPNGLLRYRVDAVERKVDTIEQKIDRLIMAIVAAAFTLAGAILLLAINLLVLRQGG